MILLLGAGSIKAQFFANGSFQLSNIKYFGINLEAEKLLKSKELEKETKKGKLKIKNRQFLVFANLGFYQNAGSHTGLLNNYGVKYQKLTRSQFYYNIGLGLGFNTNFLPETYQVNDNNEVEKLGTTTRTYLSPILNFGIGRQFKKSGLVDAIYLRQNNLLLLNYNYGINVLLNTELGLRFNLITSKKAAK